MKNNIVYQMFLRSATRGGTLRDGEKLLPHIASLGVDVVYLCPVFEADKDMDTAHWSARQCESGLNNPQNPYRIKDYFKIDEEYGTDEDLKNFVHTAHTHGLKVVFDLVYYHCGPCAKLIDIDKNFVKRMPNGEPDCGEWRFPRLNYDCKELREYLYGNMEYLVRTFDVDGFRCDVGDLVPLDFWREGIRRIHAIKPNLLMINEGNHVEFIKSGIFDINYYLSWGEDTLKQLKENFTDLIGNADMLNKRFICFENHDAANDAGEYRLDKKYGHSLCDALLVLIFTCGCVPFIYNGNEIGDYAKHSIYGNRYHGNTLHIDWSAAVTEDGKHRFNLIRSLCDIYHKFDAIADGKIMMLYDKSGLIAFARTTESEKVFVAVNLSNHAERLTLKENDRQGADKVLAHGMTEHGCDMLLESGGFAVYHKQM